MAVSRFVPKPALATCEKALERLIIFHGRQLVQVRFLLTQDWPPPGGVASIFISTAKIGMGGGAFCLDQAFNFSMLFHHHTAKRGESEHGQSEKCVYSTLQIWRVGSLCLGNVWE